MLDRQIRSLLEYEVIHRKVNNYKIGWLIPFPVFVKIETWYGIRQKCNVQFYIYRKKYSDIYNCYKLFDTELIDILEKGKVIKNGNANSNGTGAGDCSGKVQSVS
jgi:hypothetical protein